MSATVYPRPLASLLLVDHDSDHAALLFKSLAGVGYNVSRVDTDRSLHSAVKELDAQVLVIHLGPAAQATRDACATLRDQGSRVPIIAITSSSTYSDRVELLLAGADDVLSRPYAIDELMARLHALLRRSRMGVADISGPSLDYGDLHVDTDQRHVSRCGVVIKLTVKEYDLLLCLLRHPHQVISRQRLLKLVWGDTWFGDDNLLDVYIRYLRKKLDMPGLEPLIHTVRGVGFVLR